MKAPETGTDEPADAELDPRATGGGLSPEGVGHVAPLAVAGAGEVPDAAGTVTILTRSVWPPLDPVDRILHVVHARSSSSKSRRSAALPFEASRLTVPGRMPRARLASRESSPR